YSADSLAAAERAARKWARLQPCSLNGWTALGGALEFQGKYAAAESAYARAETAQPELSDLGGHRVELAIRAARFDLVDSLLAHGLASENADESGDALWKSVLSYRTQGRMREALRAARTLRARDARDPGLVSLEARVLLEMRHYREAAQRYDSMALAMVKETDANTQRSAAAWFTNEATALVALRDTARLDDLERWVRHYGSLSSEMRDRTLYHYVNAMRRELAGDLDGAIVGYRAAIGSPIGGNVRAMLALGRALTRRGRAAEALPVLDAAIRGALGASGSAVTKTELHEAFAQALDASGHTTRAIKEYAWVTNAWRRADPEIVARRMRSEQRIAALANTR
ncbi:MAG TPA: hypothetical protein VM100_11620, partial [Longimicrobiales bacterium]|nr:hypothetical protein [Longimicrobiales bacterium]